MPGLDPGIHRPRSGQLTTAAIFVSMDCRVKPGNDTSYLVIGQPTHSSHPARFASDPARPRSHCFAGRARYPSPTKCGEGGPSEAEVRVGAMRRAHFPGQYTPQTSFAPPPDPSGRASLVPTPPQAGGGERAGDGVSLPHSQQRHSFAYIQRGILPQGRSPERGREATAL